jgi:rSAM/selenodomain-associated transferase 1
MKPVRILVFAKAPLPGQVKTRLIPALGEAGAARLAARMLDRAVNAALAAAVGPVELCMSPAPGAAAWSGIPLPPGIETSDQGSGDLGARMARAAWRTLDRAEAALLIGTDCPELTAKRLRRAAAELANHDAVMYAAHDGGYPLLGLRRFDASVFAEMPWSTPAVGALTRERLASLGWNTWVGEPLHDIDTPEDLVHGSLIPDFGLE